MVQEGTKVAVDVFPNRVYHEAFDEEGGGGKLKKWSGAG
jgi:hypothetical protein